MKTSIIILTYNNLNYTKMCIESIRSHTKHGSYEIIVVDNNSNDGTVQWLEYQKDIRTIFNCKNLGFPKACNQGIMISQGDNILLLNNDTIVTENWLENLRICLYSSDNIGAVGAVTNSCSNYQAVNTTYTNLQTMQKFASDINKSDPAIWEYRLRLIGFCMLIKKNVIEEIGLLEEQFGLGNFEDDDYSFRIRKAGYRLMLCKDVFIHHFGSVSFKTESDEYIKLLKVNKEKFNKKWGFEPYYISEFYKGITEFIKNDKIYNDDDLHIFHIGCGGGGILLDIKNQIPEAILYGSETNEQALTNTDYFANIKSGSMEIINKFEKDTFDYIIASVHNEKIEDLKKIVQYSEAYLKENGSFILIINEKFSSQVEGFKKYLEETFNNRYAWKSFKEANVEIICIKSMENNKIYNLLSNINNGINEEESAAILISMLEEDETKLNEIAYNFEFDIKNKVYILNLMGVKCYENNFMDFVIPFFQKALEYDCKNKDANYNLALILEAIGEYELAYGYIKVVCQSDDTARTIADRIYKKIKSDEKNPCNILEIEQNNVTFTGERLVINKEVKEKYSDVLEEHVVRYELACKFARGKKVLDAACGTGYGTRMLKDAGAVEVTGVDISEESLHNAKKDYHDTNLTFSYGDVNSLPYNDKSFDLIISFETIEHINDGAVWIRESARLLEDDGIFIVSTPNRCVTNPGIYAEEQPLNPYHKYEYNIGEFIGELLKEYDIQELYGQTFVKDKDMLIFKIAREFRKLDTNYVSDNDNSLSGHKLICMSDVKNVQPMYLVAVCKKKTSKTLKKTDSLIEKETNNLSEEKNIRSNSEISKGFNSFGENSFIDKDYKINRFRNISIGNNIFVKDNCWLNICTNEEKSESMIKISDGCQIGSRFSISVSNKCTIEKNVIIGPNVYIADCQHNYENIAIPIMYQGITSTSNEVIIGENSWLGINSVIVGNVRIGKGTVIGANSFVKKDIPDYCVAVGNPAKVIKAFDIETGKWIRINNDDELHKCVSKRNDLLNYILNINSLKSLQIEVSSACNLKCPQCFNNIDGHKTGFFNKQLWDDKINPYLKQLKDIHLVGIGEPLLCKDFFYYVEDSVNNGVKVHTTSNLQLVDEKIAEKVVASGIFELSFSCDGSTDETYREIRVNGTLDKLKESLSLINKYKIKYNSAMPKLILNFGAMRKNINELPDIVKFAHENKVDSIIAYHNIIFTENLKEESLYHYQNLSDEKFIETKNLADNLGVSIFLPGLFSNPIKYCSDGIYCSYPFAHLWIYSDGRVGPCCMDFPDRYVLGNINESTLQEVWNSLPILGLRKELATNPSEICRYCTNHGKMEINNPEYLFHFIGNKVYLKDIASSVVPHSQG